MREPHCGLHRAGLDLHLVVLLQHGHDAAQHLHAAVLVRLVDLHDLEASGERRVLLEVLLVLGPGGGGDGAQLAARERGLEQVGGIAGAGRAAGADEGVRLVDEQDGRLGRGLHLVDDLAQAVLELALHAGAGLQHAQVERADADLAQRGRDVALDHAQREALDHRGLAHAGLAGEDGVVLAPPHQDVDDLADLLVAAEHGIDLAGTGLGGEVLRVARERAALGALAGHRARGLARGGAGGHLLLGGLGRALGEGFELVDQAVGLDAVELARQAQQGIAQRIRLDDPHQQRAAAHVAGAEHDRSPGPAALDGVVDVGGEVGDGAGAARQRVQRARQVGLQAAAVELESLDEDGQVTGIGLQQLEDPVHQLHVRVAPHLAEHGGRLEGLVGRRAELGEEPGTADFGHVLTPSPDPPDSLAPCAARAAGEPLTPAGTLRPALRKTLQIILSCRSSCTK